MCVPIAKRVGARPFSEELQTGKYHVTARELDINHMPKPDVDLATQKPSLYNQFHTFPESPSTPLFLFSAKYFMLRRVLHRQFP